MNLNLKTNFLIFSFKSQLTKMNFKVTINDFKLKYTFNISFPDWVLILNSSSDGDVKRNRGNLIKRAFSSDLCTFILITKARNPFWLNLSYKHRALSNLVVVAKVV